MANSANCDGNAFIDELYSTIYTGILQNCPGDAADLICNVEDKLESPQRYQFVSLFVKLKIKNEPLGVNSVLQICHRLLEENKPIISILQPNRIISPSELNLEKLLNEKNDRNKTDSMLDLYGKRTDDTISSNRITLSADAGTQFGQKILLDLVHRSQGTECIKMDAHACKTIPNLELIITHVTELGRLHNVIKNYVYSDNEHCGHVAKALRFDLQQEMNSYYVYINMWLSDNFNLVEQFSDTLHKLIPLDYNVLTRFRCLAKIVKNAKGKNGCNLISSLVNSNISNIGSIILNETSKSVHSMIVRWMADGEVEDQYEEFFIVKTSSDKYWENSHTISSTNMLDFLNKCQLNDIYQTGKNMGFLLKFLGPKINIVKLREEIKNLANENGFLIMLADKYSKTSWIVSSVCAQSSILLMDMLMDKYNLFAHFEGFRNYMLLGRGDFYAYVISQLEPFFGKNEIHYYQLKDIMDNAYHLTSACNDDKKLFNNLKYKIEMIGDIVNWNSFKFEYVTDEPLNQIFGPCFNHYTNVFEFLWRLKKVDWTTNKMWQELAYFTKKSYTVIELKPVLRNVNTLISNMLNCVNEIQNFIFEMINVNWKLFEINTYGASCVKTVTDAHMSVLESITECVDDKSVSLDAYVELLKNNVEQLAEIFRNFVGTWWKFPKSREGSYGKCGENAIDTFLDDFKNLKQSYEAELCYFLSKLTDCKTRDLVPLALRIDFNGYYSSKDNSI